MKFPLHLLLALLPAGLATAQFNINDAFVASELAAGAITFPGPLGGTIQLGYNLTPASAGTFLTAGLIHTDNWATAPALQGWYYPNGVIVPALIVNTTATGRVEDDKLVVPQQPRGVVAPQFRGEGGRVRVGGGQFAVVFPGVLPLRRRGEGRRQRVGGGRPVHQ